MNLQSQVPVTGQVLAEVIEALTATETNQLHFGRFATSATGGSIVITPEGNRYANGSVMLVSGPFGPGQFVITGFPEATFIMLLPEGPSVLSHQPTNRTMIVDNWVSSPPAGSGPLILSNGTAVISIGATLNVGNYEQNPVGIYAGTYQLTFAYN